MRCFILTARLSLCAAAAVCAVTAIGNALIGMVGP